ncbi:hypothetical protein D9619_013011 [Psilocybe cf. subviscida]|uniref:Uncharacterized protein n=1 Tax=Psilocybe cf. subviscida TaxID=2480587 RepID=A0A8H5AZH0_9AGAR|nr:hypothetical protein D9619_013011 [Psilocybe cf. subviscida]
MELPTCVPLQIVVKPFNATGNNGVPPYYMISFPIGGTPMTTPIGSDPNNLSWTVTHPAGSQLLLSVADSTGGAGGVPPQLLTVIPGQTTQCVSTPDVSDQPFTVKANVTKTLQTCQPWGITVSGGTPPYTVTLAETNQPVITNVTMQVQGANRFTYPNRGVPGGKLIAAVSDFEGRWARGTPMVQTEGLDDETCTGLVASSGDAATIDAQDAALDAQASASKRRRALVTGVSVTLVLLLVIGCAVMCYMRYKRRANIRQKRVSEQRARQYSTTDIPQTWETFDTSVRPFEVGPSAPIYEKRSRVSQRALPIAQNDPDVEAPPYQEVDSRAASLERVMAGGSALSSTSSRNAVYEKSSPSSHQDLPRLMAATARSRSSLPQSSPSGIGVSQSSSQPTGTSLTLITTSEMVSAFPEVPASIPTKTPSIPPRSSSKTSAGFVTFPQKSVRASALSNLSATPGGGYKGANGNSPTGSAVEAITEEEL